MGGDFVHRNQIDGVDGVNFYIGEGVPGSSLYLISLRMGPGERMLHLRQFSKQLCMRCKTQLP